MDPKLQAVNNLVNQARKLVDQWKTQSNVSAEQALELQLAIGRMNEQINMLTLELGEMRTRTLK